MGSSVQEIFASHLKPQTLTDWANGSNGRAMEENENKKEATKGRFSFLNHRRKRDLFQSLPENFPYIINKLIHLSHCSF
jgi:hypothetical protein